MKSARLPLRPTNLKTYNRLFLSLLLLTAVAPGTSHGAGEAVTFQPAKRTLDIDFSYDAPTDPTKQLLGYRLYKEGVKVCETTDPSQHKMSCPLVTQDGTFKFTLTAYYSDNTESQPSPAYPFTLSSTHNMDFTWKAASGAASQGGFRIYDNGVLLYQTTDPAARQATYASASASATHAYTISAVDASGKETPLTGALSSTESFPPAAVISTSTAAGGAPLTVKFDGSASTAANPPLTYSWNFGDGSQAAGTPASHVFKTAGTYSAKLTVKDSQGVTNTVSTPIVVGSAKTDQTAASTDKTQGEDGAASALPLEVGEVSLNEQWVKVLYEGKYTAPVVVAGTPTTVNEAEPVTVRVRNVDQQGFEIRLQEWDYQDGTHAPETVNYMVIEKGVHTLANGARIEAGTFTGGNTFVKTTLQQAYNANPVVLTQVVTVNKAEAVTGRIQNVSKNSFDYKLQEMESTATAHQPETVGYIALEPGKGEFSGLLYEAGVTGKSVTDKGVDLAFTTGFPETPAFIAGMQTRTEDDTANVRTSNLSPKAARIKIEEEQSKDKETVHGKEAVGYLAIGAAAATAQP